MAQPILRSRGLCQAAGLAIVLSLAGCEDIDWDWELQEWRQVRRPIRPSRRPAPADYRPHRAQVRTGPPAPGQTPTAEGEPGPRAQPPAPSAEVPGPAPMSDQRSYYQLYVLSGPASVKAPPNSMKIRLKHARSRQAVDVLQMIYPSIGPSGGEAHRFLVYQHEPMWSAASEFVPLLDCPERAKPPPADPTEPMAAFQMAVGLFYRLNEPGQPTDFEGFKRCRRLMEATYQNDQGSGQLRWSSAILAGKIAAETFSEFGQARGYFERARGFALPGSVEEMIAVYCLADTRVHEGQRDQAVKLAQGLVKQFGSHRASYIYERASGLAKPK